MTAYLDLTGLKSRSVMPAEYFDEIETAQAGWIAAQLETWSRWIDARLRKRYAAPFAAPYPEQILNWLARIVTVRAWMRRGVDPTDPQFDKIAEDAKEAGLEIKEAAESVAGLFDLPLRADTTTSGISFGGPIGYSEASPYIWMDRQAEAAEFER